MAGKRKSQLIAPVRKWMQDCNRLFLTFSKSLNQTKPSRTKVLLIKTHRTEEILVWGDWMLKGVFIFSTLLSSLKPYLFTLLFFLLQFEYNQSEVGRFLPSFMCIFIAILFFWQRSAYLHTKLALFVLKSFFIQKKEKKITKHLKDTDCFHLKTSCVCKSCSVTWLDFVCLYWYSVKVIF